MAVILIYKELKWQSNTDAKRNANVKALGPNKIRNIIKELLQYYYKITRAKGEKVFWKIRYKIMY